MPRSPSLFTWSRLAPLALLSGCLVTFNDYPAGDLTSTGATGGGGTLSLSGSGPESGGPAGGSTSGGSPTSTGGNAGSIAAGGTDVAGSQTVGVGGTMMAPVGGSPADSGGAAAEVDPNMIDDFEDGDGLILEQQGRKGAWFVQNDGSGMQTPEAGAAALPSEFVLVRGASTRGMHTSGGPFDSWGAVIGTPLASSGSAAAPYDLSGYQGLKLWVRSNSAAPGTAKEVRLNFVTTATTTAMGGNCGTPCGDHLGAVIPLTSKWVQITVPFSSLKQTGIARPRATLADLASATSLQFLFPDNVSFDLWLDDIALY